MSIQTDPKAFHDEGKVSPYLYDFFHTAVRTPEFIATLTTIIANHFHLDPDLFDNDFATKHTGISSTSYNKATTQTIRELLLYVYWELCIKNSIHINLHDMGASFTTRPKTASYARKCIDTIRIRLGKTGLPFNEGDLLTDAHLKGYYLRSQKKAIIDAIFNEIGMQYNEARGIPRPVMVGGTTVKPQNPKSELTVKIINAEIDNPRLKDFFDGYFLSGNFIKLFRAVVAKEFKLDIDCFKPKAPRGTAEISSARQIAIYAYQQLLIQNGKKAGDSHLAEQFGRDHSTMGKSNRKVSEQLEDEILANQNDVRLKINAIVTQVIAELELKRLEKENGITGQYQSAGQTNLGRLPAAQVALITTKPMPLFMFDNKAKWDVSTVNAASYHDAVKFEEVRIYFERSDADGMILLGNNAVQITKNAALLKLARTLVQASAKSKLSIPAQIKHGELVSSDEPISQLNQILQLLRDKAYQQARLPRPEGDIIILEKDAWGKHFWSIDPNAIKLPIIEKRPLLAPPVAGAVAKSNAKPQ